MEREIHTNIGIIFFQKEKIKNLLGKKSINL